MNITDLPSPSPSWPQDAQTAYQQVLVLVTRQSEQIEQQAKKITLLKERLNQNSKNSDKPPSSDQNKPPRKRTKSTKKRGGQKGRKGCNRALLEPTEVINKQPAHSRCQCGGEWCAEGEPERFQVTELPKIKPLVKEYHIQRHRCIRCGTTTHPGYQPKLGYSRFGPRLHAFVAELSLTYRLSIRQIKTHLKRSFGLKLSSGAISGILRRSAETVKASFDELHEWFKVDSSPKNVDETGWKLRGEKAYLIGAINKFASIFDISKNRKVLDIEALIGSELDRVIISDRAKVYQPWTNRQLCWAHVLRAFIFISEARGGKTHGEPLVDCADNLFQANKKWRAGELSVEDYLLQTSNLKTKVKRLLNTLNKQKRLSELAAGKVRHLLKFFDQLWTFHDYPDIPIHNNDQERELRNPVIKRKLSFGNDSIANAKRYALLLSVIQTLNRQGRSWREWFIKLCEDQAESLVPQTV